MQEAQAEADLDLSKKKKKKKKESIEIEATTSVKTEETFEADILVEAGPSEGNYKVKMHMQSFVEYTSNNDCDPQFLYFSTSLS